tara:strand:+ start:19003 stop:20220 length:1218 start_codon:yes stop_codon:yes gene_type:complete
MSGTIIQAKNPSNNYQSLLVDSSGRLECSVNEIELTATQISLNVDNLETLTTAGNNTLSSIDNKVVLPSALDGGKLKVVDSALVDVGNKIDAMRGSNSITDLATKLNAGLPSALSSSGNLKVSIEEGGGTSDATSALQTAGNNTLSSIDNKLVLPSALDSGKLKVVDSAVVDNGNKIDAMRASDTLTTLKGELTSGNSIVKIMGSETGATGGTQRQLHVNSSGQLQIDPASVVAVAPSNSFNSDNASHVNSFAVGIRGRTDTTDHSTGKFLLCDSNGRLAVINRTGITNHSEVSYVSGQSISGSGTHEGASISVDANTKAFYVEHNFSHTGIKYEILASIDNSNFFSTGVEFNAGGMTPATLTGINTILGTASGVVGFPPFIKFKFTNSDSSVQSATLSYVQQIS